MVVHDGAYSLPRSAQPWWYSPASLQEERIRELYNTLQLIQIFWEESTSQTALDINQHVKTAKQILRARPLHIILESPPEDCPFEVYVSSPSGKVILSGLITLHFLRQTMALTRVECDQLWSFNDTIWPRLLRWSDYLHQENDKYEFSRNRLSRQLACYSTVRPARFCILSCHFDSFRALSWAGSCQTTPYHQNTLGRGYYVRYLRWLSVYTKG